MPWQKIKRHISDTRFIVESKDGNTYPAEVRYDWMGESVYEQMVSNGTPDDVVFWAWVNFDEDDPIVEETKRRRESEGPPDSPPWDEPPADN